MYTLQMPNLVTLKRAASWLNGHGNVDRAACVEVRAAEVRKLAGCIRYAAPKWWGRKLRRLTGVRPLPNEKPARNRFGRLATGLYVIAADEVDYLSRKRRPRLLGGDFRTAMSPAMRPEYWKPFEGVVDKSEYVPRKRGRPLRERGRLGFRYRYTVKRNVLPEWDFGLEENPNKGAAKSKMIGIRADWFQPLRIEKWEVGGGAAERFRRYRLVCPGNPATAGSLRHGVVLPDQERVMKFDPWTYCELKEAERWRMAEEDARFPPLSTARWCPPRPRCRQRPMKLFLVMCTKAEMEDAETARAWIDSLPARVSGANVELVGKLIARYGMLFSPRTLLCERCLDLKYGLHPDTIRRKYWRKKETVASHEATQ